MALPVTDFIVERLLEYDSTFDTGSGIATTSLMIEPLSIILQPVRDELDEVQASQSILTVLEDDDPDDYDEDVVDALASNVFIERNTGSKSSGTVRVRYFSPTNVDIGTGLASFLDSNSNRFLNTNPVAITESEMSLNVDGSLYYVDIVVEAEDEGDNDIAIGGIQEFENEPANVANVTNLTAFSGGTDKETNTELIDRIKVAVTVRALVTGRGIITTMQDNFATIEEINPRGFGDPEMQRDIVYNTHVGGHVDVWVKTPGFTEEEYDVVAIVADTTRRVAAKSSVVFYLASPVTYSLRHGGIDRSEFTPVAHTADDFITFVEGTDYNITSDITGTVSRISSGAIYHQEGSGGNTQNDGDGNTKEFEDTVENFTSVRPGMVLKITSPSSVAGTYTVKAATASTITIYGTFPAVVAGSIVWTIDDVIVFEYEYNPVSVDVIESVRSTSRTNYTITDTPLMKLKTIEVLDPVTQQPTGTYLDPTGGYGQGGYGVGGYGIGTSADYILRVSEPNLRFSADEDCFVDISRTYLGYSLRLTYDYAPEIVTYQAFMDDNQNRVETAMLKAKHFIPVYVNTGTSISYRVSASNSSALSESAMQTAVDDFIEDTKINTDLELSDIVDLLYNNGANRVNLDFTLEGEIHHTDGSIEYVSSTDDGYLVIPDNVTALTYLPDEDAPISKQIAHFIPGTITLNRTVA